MLSLVALVVVLVATAASALPAGSHEWYTGLRSPSGAPCCNERDCRPVAYRINRVMGREEIQANGAWYPVEYDKVLPFSSPDGEYHACWSNAAGRPDFRCIMLPGMVSLPTAKGLARMDLLQLAVAQGHAGNLKPAKDKSTHRIDGIVARIMAIGRAMVAQDEPQPEYSLFFV